MGLDDFASKDESADSGNSDDETPTDLDADTAIDVIDRAILENAHVSEVEPPFERQGGRVRVHGNTVVADRRTLAVELAKLLTNIDSENFKDLDEL